MAKYTVKFSCGHEGVVDLIVKEELNIWRGVGFVRSVTRRKCEKKKPKHR